MYTALPNFQTLICIYSNFISNNREGLLFLLPIQQATYTKYIFIMLMGERLGEFIKALDISKAKFAKSVGTSASRISNITTGRNKPDALMLERIVHAYPQVNPRWLLTGQGTMLQGQVDPVTSAPTPTTTPTPTPTPTANLAEQQDLTLLKQRADYLSRENELLRGYIADLRRVLISLQPAAQPQSDGVNV